MHLLLTDRLTCPRCGPQFGLVLRADTMNGRRVRDGGLGCPNCREVYPIHEGVGDVRPPPRPALPAVDLPEPEAPEAEMAQALLGVAEGPGQLLALGEAARFAQVLADRIPGLEVVGAGPALVRDALPPSSGEGEEAGGVSRLVVGRRLPFYDMGIRGVLLEGGSARDHLREAARILAPRHRVVVFQAPAGTADTLMAAGLKVQLSQDGVVVAGR